MTRSILHRTEQRDLPDSPLLSRRQLSIWLIVLVALGIAVGFSDARTGKIRGDFSKYTLAASRVMFAGGNPYNKGQVLNHNYKYFPTNAIILYPFTHIPVYAAQGIWFAINVGLLVWAFYCLRGMLRPLAIPWWVPVLTLAVTFRIINMNLRLGQWNTSVFCLSFIGLYYLSVRKWWGAVPLGLAVILKFMPAIFLLYFAARGRWKALAVTLISALFWVMLFPMLILGPGRTLELMSNYREASANRVPLITRGVEVSSLSLHSTIYRALSPVFMELDGRNYSVNLLNLPREQGALIAQVVSGCLVLAGGVWLWRQRRTNRLGELLLIGLCYVMWFLAAPGVRHAQIISVIPLTYGVLAAIALLGPGRTRAILIMLGMGTTILYTLPAEFSGNSRYNIIAEASGVIALALVVHTVSGLFAYYAAGRPDSIAGE